jgi:hypothetical protein
MWLWYKIRANGMVEAFYAPDLESAFSQARKWKPTAKAWECLGASEEEAST